MTEEERLLKLISKKGKPFECMDKCKQIQLEELLFGCKKCCRKIAIKAPDYLKEKYKYYN